MLTGSEVMFFNGLGGNYVFKYSRILSMKVIDDSILSFGIRNRKTAEAYYLPGFAYRIETMARLFASIDRTEDRS